MADRHGPRIKVTPRDEAQHAEWRAAAADAGLSLSAWLAGLAERECAELASVRGVRERFEPRPKLKII